MVHLITMVDRQMVVVVQTPSLDCWSQQVAVVVVVAAEMPHLVVVLVVVPVREIPYLVRELRDKETMVVRPHMKRMQRAVAVVVRLVSVRMVQLRTVETVVMVLPLVFLVPASTMLVVAAVPMAISTMDKVALVAAVMPEQDRQRVA